MTTPAPDVRYPLHEQTLDNGLRVVVSPDHAAPVTAVNLWYDVGSRHEQPGRTGFAHLFEHVMFQGSGQVASGEHIGLVQAAGGSVNATTWFDRTNYFEAVPTGALDLALWLEADRMGSLLDALTQANLDTQREVVKEEKRQRYDNVPYGDVMEHLVTLTFPAEHPYGHTTIGSMADLDAASLEDAQEFFRRFYMPNNAVLTLAGDITPDDGFDRARRWFGDLPAHERPGRPEVAVLGPLTDRPRREVRADVPADAVYLTWRLPALDDPDFDPLDLAFAVLGEGQTARLHRSLVRTAELAESAHAAAMGLIGGNAFGYASARARDDVPIDRVEAALVEQIDQLTEQGPSEADLHRAKAHYERSWLQALARLESRADEFSAMATLLGDPGRVNTRLDEINAVDVDQVRQALRRWLPAGEHATLVYRQEETR